MSQPHSQQLQKHVNSQFMMQLEYLYGSSMENIQNIQEEIHQSLEQLQKLKGSSIDIKEKKFVSTFMKIMDKMSFQLQKATQASNNIDQQIKEEPECVYQQAQLQFFQKECLTTNEELREKKRILQEKKAKYHKLLRQKESLQGNLRSKTSKDLKYKAKAEQYFQKTIEFDQPYYTYRGSSKSPQYYNTRTSRPRNFSIQLDLQNKIERKSTRKVPHSISSNTHRATTDFYLKNK